jgi:thiol:disulfide interchange protein DsbD
MIRVLRLLVVLVGLFAAVMASAEERVKWTATLPPDAKAGAAATVTLTAEVEKGWHFYALATKVGNPTQITAADPLKLAGTIEPSKPIEKPDPNFNNALADFYDDSATFTVPVTLGPDPTNEALNVNFQACNDRVCELPKSVEVPLSGQAAKPVVVKGDVDQARDKGLLSFLLFAFTAGLLSLLTPCVFPMVPITVSFFAKRREGGTARSGVTHALAYCFGIISAFTAVGLLISVLFGASGIQKFATNPFVNLILATIFILLALNLFGMFQLTLPYKLTNAFSSRGKTGLLAPLLMGLTFTLTTFTCTVPFVGTILVSAANGDLLYPVLGMLAFSTAFALPFFLLALFPQYLANLPKSGAWLEMTKAFMGFLELAAAVKFLSNADLFWGTGLISRSAFLVTWAIILSAAALFLVRVIRLPKVELPAKIGPGRVFVVAASVAAAVYLASGATGRSLGEIEAFLPPGKADGWITDYDRARAIARRDHKPLLIDFTGYQCTNCRWMERNMFPRPDVSGQLPNYTLTRLFTDGAQDGANRDLELKLTNKITLPIYVVLTPDGRVIRMFEGSTRVPADFVAFLAGKSTAVASR